MQTIKFGLLIAFIFSIGFISIRSVESQNRSDDVLLDAAERITKDEFTFSTKTPKGARIFSVNNPNYKMLTAIDKGLEELIAVAKKHNYSKRLKYSDYTIFIAKADRTRDSNKNYSPDIAVSAGQYEGSDYDQGGYIYAAGMVLAYTPCAFIVAEHTKNFERVTEVTRYEGEHLVLYHNDRRLFNETADHSKGGGHPILK